MGKVTEALSNAGSQIKSDFKHATGIQPYTDEFVKADYDNRTAASLKRMQDMQAQSRKDNSGSGGGSNNSGGDSGGGDDVTSPADMYAENKRRYDEFKAKQKADAGRASGMDRARRMYEQMNRGAGPIPRQMQGLGQFRNPFAYRPMPRDGFEYRQGQQTQPFQGSGYQTMPYQQRGNAVHTSANAGSPSHRRQPFQGSGYRGDGYNMGRVATDSPPSMMAPGTGGSGVQRDVNQPSSARARELMMAGDTAAAMRMLKASTGMEDTSLSSQDALNYYKNSGDQAGTQNILRSSVGLPQEQVARPAVMPPYNDRMPMLPMPQPMPQNQATSPAFRYAGQNYGRLGGQQRMYDRPMEMMSQRERQGVNRIYDDMRTIRPMSQPSPFYSRQGGQQQGIAQLLQNALANKGGGRTAPQPQMPRYQTMPQRPNQQRGNAVHTSANAGSPSHRSGLPSIGGKGAGRTMPQRPAGQQAFIPAYLGQGGDPRFGRVGF